MFSKFRSSISRKFAVALLVPLTIGLALIVATVARFVAKSTEQAAIIQAQDAAHAISDRLRVGFEESMVATRTLRDTVQALREVDQISRTAMTTLMRKTLEDNPEIYGIWASWESEALDGRDKDWVNTPYGDATGRYAKYVVRHGDAIAIEPLEGYEGPDPLAYYALPKQNRTESVVEPYGYFTDGHWLLLTTFSEPLIIDGRFVGALGSDIALDQVQKIVSESHPLGTGRVSLISDRGAWLSEARTDENGRQADVVDPSLSKAAERAASGTLSIQRVQSLVPGEGEIVRVFVPLVVGRSNTAWTVVVTLPVSSLFGQARKLLVIIAGAGVLLVLSVCAIVVWTTNRLIGRRLKLVTDRLKQTEGEDFIGEEERRLLSHGDEIGLVASAVHTFRASSVRSRELLEQRETALRIRSEQLLEAQSLGRIGDWSYAFGSKSIWWSPHIYELLNYDPEAFDPTRQAVLSLCVGDGARRILEAQAEVMRSGVVRSVDIQLRRGDATVGDFAITNKSMVDSAGRFVGVSGTIQDITERKSSEKALERLAYYDPLTGLANRALFHRDLDEAFGKCLRTRTQAALLVLDLDHFKEVNDSLGHAAGDQVLGEVGRMISRVLPRNHLLSRLGGDEFAIIMPEVNEEAVLRAATEIGAIFDRPLLIDHSEVSIGTSIGIVLVPRDGSNLADLQRHADMALYRAKEDGRGRFRFFDPKMSDVVLHKIALARDLRKTIQDGGQLAVHYQPQVNLSGNRVVGYEALMRWNHPVLGNVPPGEFIPIAESSQLICDLGAWILREAAAQGKRWLDAGEAAREIAVNVSAAQIWQTDFAADVSRILSETGLPPRLLCLELTESLLINQGSERVKAVMTELKRLGVTLALDDFGTDYSSLGYLTQLPFDKLKIDRIFVNSILVSERARKLLEGVIALGRGLGMTIVVEGAETPEEVEIIRDFHVDIVQGYAFARPTVAEQALAFARGLEIAGPAVEVTVLSGSAVSVDQPVSDAA